MLEDVVERYYLKFRLLDFNFWHTLIQFDQIGYLIIVLN